MHSPVTNWTISLRLSCHVSDHTQSQDGDTEELASLQKADRYIHQAIIQRYSLQYFSCTNQADPIWRGLYLNNGEKNIAGGEAHCRRRWNVLMSVLQESGTGYYRPLSCNGVKLVGYRYLMHLFPRLIEYQQEPVQYRGKDGEKGGREKGI